MILSVNSIIHEENITDQYMRLVLQMIHTMHGSVNHDMYQYDQMEDILVLVVDMYR